MIKLDIPAERVFVVRATLENWPAAVIEALRLAHPEALS
jgi:hypothetical protein